MKYDGRKERLMPNPYIYRGMIRDPDAFFGRQKELGHLYASLAGMQSVSVVGERHIGKSSLLYCARLPQLQARIPGYDFTNHVFAYLDLTRLARLTPAAFLRWMLAELRSADDRLNWLAPRRQVRPEDFEDAIDEVNEKGLKPVFLLDEFDKVAQVEKFDLAFFDFLRFLANGKDMAFVTASTRRLSELCHASVVSSPFFNIFTSIQLGLLQRDEALRLIEEPSAKAGCSLADDAEFLLSLAGRHPFFLQMACFYLFEAKSKGGGVDYETVTRLFRNEVRDHFEYLWGHLTDVQRQEIGRNVKVQEPGHSFELLESSSFRQFVEEKGTGLKTAPIEKVEHKSKVKTWRWLEYVVRYRFYIGLVMIGVSLALALLLNVTEALLLVLGTVIALAIVVLKKAVDMRSRE
jgi:hypothetical protein